MVAAQIYEIVFIPFQKTVKFCFFWRKMGGSWVGREHSEHVEQSECCLEGLEHSVGLGGGFFLEMIYMLSRKRCDEIPLGI